MSSGRRQAFRLAAMRWWHIPAIVALERDLFGDEAWSAEMFWSELANLDSHYLIAELIAELIAGPIAEPPGAGVPWCPLGYGGLTAHRSEAYIQTIGVARAAQRAGIGRRLMDALLEEGLRRGAGSCWLEVRTDNEAAQQLYRRLGFADRGVRRGYYQPSGGDALVMAAQLPVQPGGGLQP